MNSFKTPLDAFLYWEKNAPSNPFLKQFVGNTITTYSYKSAGEEIRRFAGALGEYNLSEKSHIAILSKNCAHWVLADFAIMMAGHISIPIDSALSAKSINKILTQTESKIIIIGKLDNFKEQEMGIPDIIKVNIDRYTKGKGDTWENLVLENNPIQKVRKQHKDDLMTIVYTSGTTKNPKGVMHSVGNIIEASKSFIATIKPNLSPKLPDHPNFFCYLPFDHITERVGIMNALMLGGVIYIPESLMTFSKNIKIAKPNILNSVPTVWIKYHERILNLISQKKLDISLKIPLLNAFIKNRIKRRMGLSETEYIVCGAASLSINIIKWFQQIDIEIFQGYGTTEDTAISHYNYPGASKLGTVGRPMTTIETKLSNEGEILIKNNCLMMGYFKEPELTKNAFDADGYFKTGDLGRYDKEGYLTILGRKKAAFKTHKGKYVTPEYIEHKLVQNVNIEQACIVGEGLPQPIALINLSETGTRKVKQQVMESIIKTIFIVNHSLEKHERIHKVIAIKNNWTIENDLMTPTLKIKRINIEKIYGTYYKSWYESDEKVIFENFTE